MTREQILKKVEQIQTEWSAKLGKLTDIWIHPELLDILDDRPLIERVQDPLVVNEVYVTPFSPLTIDQVRIAFVTEVDFGLEEELDEIISTDGPTPVSE